MADVRQRVEQRLKVGTVYTPAHSRGDGGGINLPPLPKREPDDDPIPVYRPSPVPAPQGIPAFLLLLDVIFIAIIVYSFGAPLLGGETTAPIERAPISAWTPPKANTFQRAPSMSATPAPWPTNTASWPMMKEDIPDASYQQFNGKLVLITRRPFLDLHKRGGDKGLLCLVNIPLEDKTTATVWFPCHRIKP